MLRELRDVAGCVWVREGGMIWGSREGIALLRVSLCHPYVVCSFASASDWGLGEGHVRANLHAGSGEFMREYHTKRAFG